TSSYFLFLITRPPPRSTLFPYTTLFRSLLGTFALGLACGPGETGFRSLRLESLLARGGALDPAWLRIAFVLMLVGYGTKMGLAPDRKSTRLNSSHDQISYAVFCLKKKK